MPLIENIIQRTCDHIPELREAGITAEQINRGGSMRHYYRLRTASDGDGLPQLLCMHYSPEPRENLQFVPVTRFLDTLGVQIPRIWHHDPGERMIWVEDIGRTDLWEFRNEPWDVRRPLYEGALEEVLKIHAGAPGDPSTAEMGVTLHAPFNEKLYLWEQNYFFANTLKRLFHFNDGQIENLASIAQLRKVARELGRLPRALIHRDFQSQNILIRDDSAWLIDYQGLRPGLPEYDLASLLYDPYVELTSGEKRYLLYYYYRIARREAREDIFVKCALQRMMQALGAYGFLGKVRKLEKFLGFINPGLDSLRHIAELLPGLWKFRDALDELHYNPDST